MVEITAKHLSVMSMLIDNTKLGWGTWCFSLFTDSQCADVEFMLQKLGAQSLTVSSEGFIPMLTRLDECVSYVQSNVSYIE